MKVTSTDIKNSFGKYLRLCTTEPVYITKNGKTIAKLLNHTIEDDIIENSNNLSKLYDVEGIISKDYMPSRLAESLEAYNLDRLSMGIEEFNVMNKDANNRYEFIDGEVYMLAAPSVFHQRLVSRLHIAFDQYLKGEACDVFVSPFDVTLYRQNNNKFTNIVQPDLLVICNWRDDVSDNGQYMGIPKLVIEVLSPGNSKKEMITKLDLYKDSGIEEYWIVDDVKNQVIIYHFKNYEIVGTRIYKAGELCKSFVYDEFEFNAVE